MKGFENETYLIGYIISNIAGLLILWAAIKLPRLARLLFAILFAWAFFINFKTAHHTPLVYLEYAEMSVRWYSDFIKGWFSGHITAVVSFIAFCQALISLGMFMKGILLRLAVTAAIIFFFGIAPLGVGAAFPFSITASIACLFILRNKHEGYLWQRKGSPLKKRGKHV